jgi:vancomycin permeability regulator SanA
VQNNSKYYFITIFLLLLAQFAALLIIKYLNQNLPLSYFSVLKTGNLFNMVVYAGMITGIFLTTKKYKTLVSRRSVIIFIIVSWVLLLISFVSTRIRIISANAYIFNQPGDKVLTGLLFLIYLLSLFYFLIYLWSRIIKGSKSKVISYIFSTVVLLIISLVLTAIYIDNIGYASGRWKLSRGNENIAIVLGAAVWKGNIPSPTLSSRVEKALELLEEGFAGKIILTGGSAPGELPEAEVAYEYARVKGVDTSKVIIEILTSSTADQIRWINNYLMDNKISAADIILISDAYHVPRAIEISKFFNLNVKVAESVHKQDFKDQVYTKIRESIALFNFWNFAL